MSFHITKMHGCGNDFLILDGLREDESNVPSKEEILWACDRNFGIGADGLVVLMRASDHDAKWKFFNCDGSEAAMCGNAARCVIRYLADHYPNEGDHSLTTVMTEIGVIRGKLLDAQGLVEVTLFPQGNQKFSYEEKVIRTDDDVLRVYYINTGVPHAVIEVPDLEHYPINSVGQYLVNHPVFQPNGTNVTFMQKVVASQIKSTTFERGVEKETFACGTGALAAAVIYSELYLQNFPIKVSVPGGELEVDLSPVAKVVLLRGQTEYVMKCELPKFPSDFEKPALFGTRVRRKST